MYWNDYVAIQRNEDGVLRRYTDDDRADDGERMLGSHHHGSIGWNEIDEYIDGLFFVPSLLPDVPTARHR